MYKGAISLKNKAYSPALNEYSCELIVLIIILAIMFSEFLINYRFVIRRKESKARTMSSRLSVSAAISALSPMPFLSKRISEKIQLSS